VSAQASLAKAFLALERLSRSHHRLVIILALGVLAIGSALSATLQFDTDVMNLLPQKDPAVKAFRETARDFGALDVFPIVIDAAEGYEAEDYEEIADLLAEKLREDPAIAAVETGIELDSPLIRNAQEHLPLLLDDAGLQELRLDLEDGAIRSSVADLKGLLEVVPSPELRELAKRDPLRLTPLLLRRLGSARGQSKASTAGGRIVSKDGRALMIVARPSRPAQDVASSTALVGRVRELIASSTTAVAETDPELPAPRFLLGGRYTISVEDNALILGDIGKTMVFSFLGVVLLYLYCYRRLGAILYSALPLMVGQCLTFTLAKLAFGSLNSATATSAGLLMGLGTDFTIVMYARFVEERNAGKSVEEASRVMMGETALGVYTGALTSAGTFGALMATGFVGLRQFGFLIGCGILLCLLAILLILPALVVALEERRRKPRERLYLHSFGFEKLIPLAREHPRTALLACAVVSLIALPLALDLELTESIESLRSSNNAGIRAQEEIKQRFGTDPNFIMVVSKGRDPAEVERRSRSVEATLLRMRDAGSIERVEGLGAMLPPEAEQEARRQRLLADPAFDPDRVEATLRQALRDNGLREEPFAEGIAILRSALRPADLVTEASIAAHGGADLLARFVRPMPDGGIARATYAYGVLDPEDQAVLREADPEATIAGVSLLTRSLKRILKKDVATCLALGLAIVAVLLVLDFRSWTLCGLALTQLVVGLLWMLGAMRALSVPLTMINSFAAALLLGVGIDYGIHILHRLRGPDAGDDEAVAETGKAVAMAAMTNVVGFGVLLTSNYPGLRGLGASAVLGSIGCMLTALVLLPALDRVVDRRKERAR
jgi:uncharacterized protein